MQLSPIVILRRVYLGIVNNNHCAAKLIEYFKHWTEWKLEHHRTGWIYMPIRQICLDLMGEHSPNIVRKAIAFLIDTGILEQRRNPGNGQDRTWQYRLNFQVLDQKLADNGDINSGVPLLNSEQYPQNPTTKIRSTTTTAVMKKEEVAEETCSSIVQETDLKPTNEQLDEALVELSAVSPNIQPNSSVRKFLIQYWANLLQALERLKKAVRENWRCNLTGVFINALKEPPKQLSAPPAKEYPHPTLEQLNELGTKGKLVHTVLDEPGNPQVLAVDTGTMVMPWWQALGLVHLEQESSEKFA